MSILIDLIAKTSGETVRVFLVESNPAGATQPLITTVNY
jgi:hypothetical protein